MNANKRLCPECNVWDGHKSNCTSRYTAPDVPKPSEEARFAIDTIRKWSLAMGRKWREVREKMMAVGLSQGQLLPLGKPKILCHLSSEYQCVMVEKDKKELGEVIANPDICPDFDISTLSEIRRLVTDAIKDGEAKVQAVLDERVRKRLERHNKINQMLPAIADEFGADIMQFDPDQPKTGPKPTDNPFFKRTP